MSESSKRISELGYSDPSSNYRRSVSITIDLSAIRANLATAKRLSFGGRQFATIKADAYGHGAVAVAHALSPRVSMRQYGKPDARNSEPDDAFADGFAVVTVSEAIELRQSGISQPILVLQGPQNKDDCVQLLRHDLWPVIHDIHQIGQFCKFKDQSRLHAWLKVDTGMGRLGFQPSEVSRILSSSTGINWLGMLTHFASADETTNQFTDRQMDAFNTVSASDNLQRSLANSAAILAWPRAKADWARPGIMLYGCNPLDCNLPDGVNLLPAMTVRAPLISVKQMRAGSGIGYAQTWHCPEDMPVGYVALGYRDGLPRVLDDSATVSICGASCAVVGRVSMDSIAVDLRACPLVEPGTLVEFWGEKTSIDDLARAAGTISYELLTSIKGRREYVTQLP